MNSFLSSKDEWAWEFQRQHKTKMCISKQTVKNRLCLLLKPAADTIKWVKSDILAQRTQTFKDQKGEQARIEANLHITGKCKTT